MGGFELCNFIERFCLHIAASLFISYTRDLKDYRLYDIDTGALIALEELASLAISDNTNFGPILSAIS